MFDFPASSHQEEAAASLQQLLAPAPPASLFDSALRKLDALNATCVASCPPPWSAPGLIVTPEIHYQSELWLPLAEIRPTFERWYRLALTCPPILSSTPFHAATSWGALACELPEELAASATPGRLLRRLLLEREAALQFLCWSFMPRRFYGGGSDRYPQQLAVLGEWLERRRGTGLRCLDAACGEGGYSYRLACLLQERGWQGGEYRIEGWTLEPLEAWAAAYRCLPHDRRRQQLLRSETEALFNGGHAGCLSFRQADLLDPPRSEPFDAILCNGLLGGPIINSVDQMGRVIAGLAALLVPGGLLLAADHFHGGWKKRVPEGLLVELLEGCGLVVREAGEGIAGWKSRDGGRGTGDG